MIQMILALGMLAGVEMTPASAQTGATAPHEAAASEKVDRFAGRPQARIAFTHEVRNFQVKRDGYDDILYLETRRDRWFRSEINCIGISDPRDAHGLLPIDRSFGFDRFSRVALVSFGHRTTECRLENLIELTPEEAIELRLVKRRTPPNPSS